jgi:hypothetical protein
MILCPHCATAIDSNDAACPNCGVENNSKNYYRILAKVNQYILFGYSYRKKYEKQYAENGKIKTKFHLGFLSEPFAWVGLAVLSGVVGGASWDFVKYLSKKIASQFADEDLSELVSDEIKLIQFSEFLLDYHQSFRGVKDDVRDAIFEEMRAHTAEDLMMPMELDFDDKAAMLRLLKKVSKKAGEKHRKSKLSMSIVKGLWGKAKISIDLEQINEIPNKANSADTKSRAAD